MPLDLDSLDQNVPTMTLHLKFILDWLPAETHQWSTPRTRQDPKHLH